ncbi:MAG TPA: 30S ribosome-binding factor RbfA [Spirochaetes bacterium]|nr:30S ribosome-binding factor RbfA [Spirochaetota bacterium]
MAYYRNKRAGSLLREEISLMIQREIKDPRITGFITITGVEVTKDLRVATVHVSILGDEKSCKSTLQGLRSATGYMKKRLGKILSFKYIPEIRFEEDNSLLEGSKIYQQISDLEEKGDPGSTHDGDAEE